MADAALKEKLENIKKVFDIEKLLALKMDMSYIQRYYRLNKIPYSLFHSRAGFIHMGISRDGVFKESDLQASAEFVGSYIEKLGATRVLELATGRGANACWLAKKFPHTEIYGIDISKDQLGVAFRNARSFQNYYPQFGDYHNLRAFTPASLDLVFVVEALCYSDKKLKVLEEVYQVLRVGGMFIIFEAYVNRGTQSMNKEEALTCALFQRGMAIEDSGTYQNFREYATRAGFTIEFEEDVSRFVLPNMQRFENMVSKVRFPFLARLIAKILPSEIAYNAISGYLMPIVFKTGLATYWITVLKK